MLLINIWISSEQEMLKEQMNSLKTLKTKLMQRITELEEEAKCAKEEAEKLAKSNKSDDEVTSSILNTNPILFFPYSSDHYCRL